MDEFLYAPWRDSYTKEKQEKNNQDDKECLFCFQFSQNEDEKNLILKRCKNSIIVLNKFPYNKAHIMIIPLRHVASIKDLTTNEKLELMHISGKSMELIKEIFGFENFNLGINIGKASGASICSHLHMHILPRYLGEAGFQEYLFHAKVVAFDIEDIYNKMATTFQKADFSI
ncbi:hypothetical protein A3F66_01125 [candidate division TM6 bacterium RIFCSPHIGHO2_12_FULL_32_22]|nr:MAG: hypothetical protein A3F66_01125 [candidate division TM6 bacterium RIFCSPHIGHO2_12_FULL_32_22]